MNEADQRAAIVSVARSWIGTKYAHLGRAKGPNGGVDCAQSIWCIYHEAGLADNQPRSDYSPEIFMHRGQEVYMQTILKHAHPVDYPKAGDIALFKVGRIFAHGGIVTQWPFIIHASRQAKCVLEERADTNWLAGRAVKFFSRW